MEKVLSLMFLMGIICGGSGLQLSLNRHASTATEKRAACGFLTCEESDTYQHESTITKMSVFKHKQSGPVTSDKPERGNLMASVTLEQPLITRESDGVKIEGRLEAGRASLRLELFTKEDCSADTETKMSSVNRLLAELLARQRTGQSDCKNLSQVLQQFYSSNGDLANDVKKYFSEIHKRRTTGNVDFYRDWATYKQGFGSLDDDFWLGNDNIHTITSNGIYELRVDLKFQGKSSFAHYSKFSIDGEDKNYALRLGNYDETAGDALKYHNGQAFSTFDRNNGPSTRNCAKYYSGAWWYHGCHNSNLNGKWKTRHDKGPRWYGFSGSDPVSYSEMKIRELRDN
ncbi:tenascin-r [Plakobranchus ocellatus]|uniref:Tenascin-r n=1 Tax=Plakobranchus ocellatus TaxID=259542 RepID=A0AAV4D8Y2_9GAST|nr:tenascin-r [Plakobranchus ocellatus]